MWTGNICNVKTAQTHEYSVRVKPQRYLAMQYVAGACCFVWALNLVANIKGGT